MIYTIHIYTIYTIHIYTIYTIHIYTIYTVYILSRCCPEVAWSLSAGSCDDGVHEPSSKQQVQFQVIPNFNTTSLVNRYRWYTSNIYTIYTVYIHSPWLAAVRVSVRTLPPPIHMCWGLIVGRCSTHFLQSLPWHSSFHVRCRCITDVVAKDLLQNAGPMPGLQR